MTVRGRDDIKSAYRDETLANDYIKARFDDPFGAELHHRQIERINRAILRARPRSLLEVACGPARLTTELAHVDRSIAVEQSAAMLTHARQRIHESGRTQWRVTQGDAFELPFPARAFDMVVTSRFLRHFSRTDRDRLLAEIRRVLHPGGYLVFDVARTSAYKWLLGKWGVPGSWVDDYWFERREFIAEMREQGFTIDSLGGVHSLLHCQYYLFNHLYPRLPWLAIAISRATTTLIPFDAYEWVAVCRSE